MHRGDNRKALKVAAGIGIIVVFAALVWLTFFYSRTCENRTCFYGYLEDCDRAVYTGKGGNNSFEYSILGQKGGECRVRVEMVSADLNNQDALKLIGKEMDCWFPLGVVADPENEIDKCHGLLKEGLQDLIISKMHRYIVQNLGSISEDLKRA